MTNDEGVKQWRKRGKQASECTPAPAPAPDLLFYHALYCILPISQSARVQPISQSARVHLPTSAQRDCC